MATLAVKCLKVSRVGEAEFNKEVVGYVEVLKKGNVRERKVGKTVLVDRNFLEGLAAVEVNFGELVTPCIEFGKSGAT